MTLPDSCKVTIPSDRVSYHPYPNNAGSCVRQCSVRIPVVKPCRRSFVYRHPMPDVFLPHTVPDVRIVRSREVSVKFTEISTIITGLAEYVAYALRIVTQRADRTCRVTVQRYTTAIRIHTGQQHSTMGCSADSCFERKSAP